MSLISRSPHIRTLAALMLAGLGGANQAQQAAPTRLTVSTRLVYVDVVVHDDYGRSVNGLAQSDFTVKEDGHPQHVVYFGDSSAMRAEAGSSLAAPSGEAARGEGAKAAREFSNVSAASVTDPAANLILLDLLDTDISNQMYALQQLVLFCRKLPAGHRVALFVLADQLRMLQGFTGSSDQLVAAAQRVDLRALPHVRGATERTQVQDMVTSFARAIGPSPGPGAATLARAVASEDQQSLVYRAYTVDDAFAQIARAAAGFPGRKNLFWLADAFPVGVAAQLQVDRSDFLAANLLDTTQKLADSQMAIYPISVAGLQTETIHAASSGVEAVSPIGGPVGSTLAPQNGNRLFQEFNARNGMYSSMNDLARATGGEAFHGTNNVAGALARSLEDGSHYYTLAYRPANGKQDGHYREILVSVSVPGCHLSYRRGYFARPVADGTRNADLELAAALQPGTLDSTMLRMRTMVEAVPAHPVVTVDVLLDAYDLSFTMDDAGHRHSQLLVSLIALPVDRADNRAAMPLRADAVLNLDLDSTQYTDLLRKGLRFREQVPAPRGVTGTLRLGVVETSSHRLGSLTMPLLTATAKP